MNKSIKRTILVLTVACAAAIADEPPSVNYDPVDPNPGGRNYSTKIVQNSSGSYVFGWREKDPYKKSEGILEKFDHSGNRIWIKTLSEALNIHNAVLVPFGSISDGAIYAAGGRARDGRTYATRLDLEGELVWQTLLPINDEKQETVVAGVTADPRNSDIYVVGSTFGAIKGETNKGYKDAFIFKLSPSGQILWSRQFGSKDFEFTEGVACDRNGNAYVVGGTEGKINPQTVGDMPHMFLAKFSPDGELLPLNDGAGNLVKQVREFSEWPLGGYSSGILIKDDTIYLSDETSAEKEILGHAALGKYDLMVMTLDLDGALKRSMRVGSDWDDRNGVVHNGNNVIAVDDKGTFYATAVAFNRYDTKWFYRINVYSWRPGDGNFDKPIDLRVGFRSAEAKSMAIDQFGKLSIAGDLSGDGELGRFFYQE